MSSIGTPERESSETKLCRNSRGVHSEASKPAAAATDRNARLTFAASSSAPYRATNTRSLSTHGSGAGVIGLGLYGFVATCQLDPHFGSVLAAHGGVFVAGSLAWGMIADGFRPDRWDVGGALVCLAGVAVILYAPRTNWPSPTDSSSPTRGQLALSSWTTHS